MNRLVVALACVVIFLVVAVCWWIAEQRHNARVAQSHGRMSQLNVALHNYWSRYQSFPSTKTTPNGFAVSWRVKLLPFLGLEDVYKGYHFNEPWDSPNNLELAQSLEDTPDFYQSPFRRSGSRLESDFICVDEASVEILENSGVRVLIVQRDGEDFFIAEIPNSGIHWMSPEEKYKQNQGD